MKVPKLTTVESFALIGGLALAAYAAYKVYSVAGTAKQSVTDTISGIGDAVSSAASGVSVAYKRVFPTSPPPLATLPDGSNYPDPPKVKYESTHATPAETAEYFPSNSPDAMGN